MKRRNLFRRAIENNLPDREKMLQSILAGEAAPTSRRLPGRRVAAILLTAVLLTVGAAALLTLYRHAPGQQPTVVESAQLHLLASGNTATPGRTTELEPQIEVRLSMWGIWRDEGALLQEDDNTARKTQFSALGIRGSGLEAYTISCNNGRLVYYPESYPQLAQWLAKSSGKPEESAYMSYIFLPAEVSYQEAMPHAQAGDAHYFEAILKDSRYQALRDRYFEGREISLSGASFLVLHYGGGGAVLCALRTDWAEDPLPSLSGQSITVLRPQENAGINWEPAEQDYQKIYEPGPFSYADFGSATITVSAQFEGGKQVEKHMLAYFSEDGYQTIRLLD